MKGYLRYDGRKGIRNVVLVAYLVECAHHVARAIVTQSNGNADVQLIGFPGCFPNEYSLRIMKRLCSHPNVSGVLLVSLGCEGFNRESLGQHISRSGRAVETLIIQEEGGTKRTIERGLSAVERLVHAGVNTERVPMTIDDLIIGAICGGSDGTSGITANPAVGWCFDKLVQADATCIFEETGELIGCEDIMAERAVSAELAIEIRAAITKAASYYTKMGYGSFAPGNSDGGLSTQEEKSMGAYAKSGNSKISGLVKPGDIPPTSGLFLLDIVPDGDPKFGFPNITDNAEIVELIASGCHLILFTTGRGSVVGSAISPVIKICANPDTYRKMPDDMDINAGAIIETGASIADIGEQIFDLLGRVAGGEQSVSESLHHNEFILTYKTFEPIGPSCLPTAR